MFEKILVPLDTSPMAEQVLPSVIELAGSFDSSIDIINVCEPHRGQEAAACQRYLDSAVLKLKTALPGQSERVKGELISGSPGQKILTYAQSGKTGLIIMSSHGRSGVTIWPMGSTVDKVLRRTGMPLIIVKVKEAQGGAPQVGLFQRILVPLDGSELGAKVVPYVVEIARKFASEVFLFHVIETDKHLHTLGRIDTVPIREEELASLKKRAGDYLNQESHKFAGSTARISTIIKAGNVAEEIIKYADQEGCALIALSSHGHPGFESWIIGSVTNKIIHASRKSLLFVPALES